MKNMINEFIKETNNSHVQVLQFDTGLSNFNTNPNSKKNYNIPNNSNKQLYKHMDSAYHDSNMGGFYNVRNENNLIITNSNSNNKNIINQNIQKKNSLSNNKNINNINNNNNYNYNNNNINKIPKKNNISNQENIKLNKNIKNKNLEKAVNKKIENFSDDIYEELQNNKIKNENPKNKETEEKIMNTIKLISNNRVKYRRTNQMMRELGKIVNNPITNFVEKENEPSNKLSEFISEKMLKKQRELNKEKKEINPEDEYYNKLQQRIKDEIKKKGSFNFSLLSEKDRKLLAQRKLYNKIGKNIYNDKININNNYNNNNNNNSKINKVEKEKIDKEINRQLNREMKKENFFDDDNEYNYNNDIDKILNEDDEDIKNIEKGLEEENKNKNEKPSAKQILENVLNKIEFKNEQLVYQNSKFKKQKK